MIFCDLVGSTAISAQLDAEEWRDLVGAYLEAASAAVAEMGGHVAKKLGDGLMCLFGYPLAHENDAERAARAALSIQRAWPSSIARTPERPSQNSSPASALNSALPSSMRAARFMATSPTLPRECRRWPSRARSWSRGGCSGRSPGCLWRKSGARTRSKGCLSRPHCSGSFAPVAAVAVPGSAISPRLWVATTKSPMLMRRWERARQGEGQLVLIVGEPGLGNRA